MIPIDTLHRELRGFIEGLRREGYNIGAAQHIAAQDLLLSLQAQGRMPAELSGLRSLLGPILCSSPKEQAEFKARFIHWAARFEAQEVVASPPLPQQEVIEELAQTEKQRRGWLMLLVAVVLALVIGTGGISLFYFSGQTTQEKAPTQSAQSTQQEPAQSTQPLQPNQAAQPQPSPSPKQLSSYEKIYTFGGIGGIVGLLLVLLAIVALRNIRKQQQSFLGRRSATEPPEIREMFIETARHGLFQSVLLSCATQQLRKHVQIESERLDIDASVRETIRMGGWFVPVQGTINVLPEYLVLIDKAAFKDQQAAWVDTLLKQLTGQGLVIERYYFNGDPRRCFAAQGNAAPLSLADLTGRYGHYRLLIFSDSAAFVNPMDGLPEAWLEQFSPWPQRTLFTLEDPMHWGRREDALVNEDFLVMPASEVGFHALVQSLNADRGQSYTPPENTAYPPLFPEILQEFPHQWLDRHAPSPEMQAELLEQLRAYLDADTFDWLCACAVYPELHWELTLFLGYQMQGREREACLSEAGLSKLVRLPWFRQGYMPDWLRETLLDALPSAREAAVRNALYQLFLEASPEQPLHDFHLEVARQTPWQYLGQQLLGRWWQQAPANSPVRDYVFEEFMDGRLKVKVRRLWRKTFNRSRHGQAKTEPVGLLRQTYLPGTLRLLWMIFMQPITLNILLRNCGLKSFRFSLLNKLNYNKNNRIS